MTIYAFTDVHGNYEIMVAAIDFIKEIDSSARIIGLGDYIDRGPKSKEVVSYLIDSGIECLRGNHEDMMITAVENNLEKTHPIVRMWLNNGGTDAVKSYKNHYDLMREHAKWMASLPVKIETEHNFFVHAGINPYKSLSEQTDNEMMWVRNLFLTYREPHEKHIVHGHTPNEGIEILSNRTNLDIGTPWSGVMAIGVFEDDVRGPVGFYTVEETTKGFNIVKYKHAGKWIKSTEVFKEHAQG